MKNSQPLPPACRDCAPHRGLWCRTADGAYARCSCPRGRRLASGEPVKRVRFRPRRYQPDNDSQQRLPLPTARIHDGKRAASGEREFALS